jgi:hypothetical protein
MEYLVELQKGDVAMENIAVLGRRVTLLSKCY